jgi:hypothetical protein
VTLWPLDGTSPSGSKIVESKVTATPTTTIYSALVPEPTDVSATFAQDQTVSAANITTTAQVWETTAAQFPEAEIEQVTEVATNITAYADNSTEPTWIVASSTMTDAANQTTRTSTTATAMTTGTAAKYISSSNSTLESTHVMAATIPTETISRVATASETTYQTVGAPERRRRRLP